jgi:hypothetical protein
LSVVDCQLPDQGLMENQSERRAAWRWFFIAMTGCAVLFGLLLNTHWVRSGEGEVYLALARHLALGQGYTFNGEPVAILPPLWPLTLAAAMRIGTAWIFLKLLPMGCMLGFLGMSYWIMLRFATPVRSAAAVLLTAILAQVYPLSIWFFSDAMFAVLAVACVLLAMQINEGRPWIWRAVLLVILSAASVAVRWNGVLWWLMILAALIKGDTTLFVKRRLPWVCAAICGIGCAATFIALRWYLRVRANQLDPRYDTFLAGAYALVNTPQNFRELLDRGVFTGGWIGGLLWDLLYDSRLLRPIGLLGGWVVLAGCSVTLQDGVRKHTWLWIAAAMQLLVLAVDWPHPMPRYLLPLAPLVIVGAWHGFERVGEMSNNRVVKVAVQLCITGLISSILLFNVPEYAMDLWAMRAPNFYRRYEAGVNRSFIAASEFAVEKTPKGQEIGITYRIRVNNRFRTTAGPMRTFYFITDRPVVLAPDDICDDNPSANPPLAQWAAQHNIRYFLWQPPIQAFYHFRGKPWKQAGFEEDAFDWRVYELRDGAFVRVRFPIADPMQMTRVPQFVH